MSLQSNTGQLQTGWYLFNWRQCLIPHQPLHSLSAGTVKQSKAREHWTLLKKSRWTAHNAFIFSHYTFIANVNSQFGLNQYYSSLLHQITITGIMIISIETAITWIAQDLTNVYRSILVQVMAWCHQAPSHYLKQHWAKSVIPYGVTNLFSVAVKPLWHSDTTDLGHNWFR